jgi:hypothetical protein
MFVDLYSVRVQSLIVAWIASCAGFYFLAPYISKLLPSLKISPVAGIAAASVFFGWNLWRMLKAGPQEGDLQIVENT